MALLDAHMHLDGYDDDDIAGVIAAIERDRILTMAVSVDAESYARSCEMAARSALVIPSFGIHPWEAPRYAARLDEIEPLIADSALVGEIGLDHRFVEDPEEYGPQRIVFDHQLRRAAEQRKLVNLHTSGAEWLVAEALAASGVTRAIVHWYNGPIDALEALVDLGCLFTVGVEVLVSEGIREIAATIPDERLLTETDNPGGWRWLVGEMGQPPMVRDVLAELARVRGTTEEAVVALVAGNLRRLVSGDPCLASWAAALDAA